MLKRLIRNSGIGQTYLDRLPGDTVTVYHGTSLENYDSIMSQGLTQGGGKSYLNVIDGLWISLNEQVAREHAIKSVKGHVKEGSNNVFGIVFSFTMNKSDLTDEGSNSNKNFMSKIPITPQMLQSGYVYKFDINTGEIENL